MIDEEYDVDGSEDDSDPAKKIDLAMINVVFSDIKFEHSLILITIFGVLKFLCYIFYISFIF